ncbi:hypothetical protein RJ639_000867 [Escallonia herrerae]|uniref:CCT domain-containing protein n=1 Tax=Escallonia herrerae TaxID=1293975 RepID=A0AA89BHK1_9ASTE|nr:hypothetical protein RJ639_000867 [Escallonia herrerae]
MAFTPQNFSGYNSFSNEFCEFPTPVPDGDTGDGDGLAMWYCADRLVPCFDNNVELLNYMVQPEYPNVVTSPSLSMLSFPERLGVFDMAVPASPDYTVGLRGIGAGAGHEGFSPGCHREVRDLGEEYCNGFRPNFWPAYPAPRKNQGNQGKPLLQEMEEPVMKVGRYSVQERKDRILRYLKKRNQRNFNKTIKYACRKTLADKRVRVRGRFAKNNEPCEHSEEGMKNNVNSHEERELYYGDDIEIKHDEEDWLQEAMASLMYVPYISG